MSSEFFEMHDDPVSKQVKDGKLVVTDADGNTKNFTVDDLAVIKTIMQQKLTRLAQRQTEITISMAELDADIVELQK